MLFLDVHLSKALDDLLRLPLCNYLWDAIVRDASGRQLRQANCTQCMELAAVLDSCKMILGIPIRRGRGNPVPMPVLPAILVQARQARSEGRRLPAGGLLRCQEILPQQPRVLAGGGPDDGNKELERQNKKGLIPRSQRRGRGREVTISSRIESRIKLNVTKLNESRPHESNPHRTGLLFDSIGFVRSSGSHNIPRFYVPNR